MIKSVSSKRIWPVFAAAIALCLSACTDLSPLEKLSDLGLDPTPQTLLKATIENQAHLVAILLDAGVNPDEARNDNHETALMLAARYGYQETFEHLISKTSNFNLVDSTGYSALSHSFANNHFDVAALLLDAGASPDAKSINGWPLLVDSTTLSQTAAVELLLSHGAKSGIEDALVIATTERKFEIAEKLLAAGVSPDAGSKQGLPALNIAIQNADERFVDLLLNAGANPNIRDEESLSAFGYAVSNADNALVQKLLNHAADPELPCLGELTAMEAAINRKAPLVLNTLITEGKTAIHPHLVTSAVDIGSPEILEVLLNHGADINTPDSNGDTLLARSIRAGDAQQANLLLSRGSDPNSLSREGQPLIALATALRKPECIVELIQAGADPNVTLTSPISEEFTTLVDSKVFTFYAKRDSRFTPLMVAASHGHGDTVRALTQNGASSSKYTKNYKRYPISFASEAKHIEAQQLIVGYDPKDRTDHYKIVINLSTQRAVMYKNGKVHISSQVSTGKSGYRTPTGEFVVTHKHRDHVSNLYHSPMPYFMRLSCQAFGTHVGYVPNYPASHGCIRMPYDKARAFFNTAPRGTPVSIIN